MYLAAISSFISCVIVFVKQFQSCHFQSRTCCSPIAPYAPIPISFPIFCPLMAPNLHHPPVCPNRHIQPAAKFANFPPFTPLNQVINPANPPIAPVKPPEHSDPVIQFDTMVMIFLKLNKPYSLLLKFPNFNTSCIAPLKYYTNLFYKIPKIPITTTAKQQLLNKMQHQHLPLYSTYTNRCKKCQNKLPSVNLITGLLAYPYAFANCPAGSTLSQIPSLHRSICSRLDTIEEKEIPKQKKIRLSKN